MEDLNGRDCINRQMHWEPLVGWGVGCTSGQSHPPKPPVLGRIERAQLKLRPLFVCRV
jgi:hypothetical protein